MREKVVVASGYFDPLHIGHVEYLEKSKRLGDKLIVIVNNTEQTILKKGFEFMPFEERMKIVSALKSVDEVFASVDTGKSVSETIQMIVDERGRFDIFAKGGDRFAGEIPEAEVLRNNGIQIVHGLGDKIQSSSSLAENLKQIKQQLSGEFS